jgi:RNA polymerase sigma-70 factor (ECF subfamily)
VTDEQRLIQKVQRSGDRMAADSLIRLYYDEIFRFVRKQTANADTAQELTQDIFVSMLRTIAHYDRRKAGFRTWLYRIAANKTVDYYRSRAAHSLEALPVDETPPAVGFDMARHIENSEFAERVFAYLAGSPSGTQRIFRLHVFGEYTFKEIAVSLHIPESTAKTTYYRLMNALRKEFSDDDGQG